MRIVSMLGLVFAAKVWDDIPGNCQNLSKDALKSMRMKLCRRITSDCLNKMQHIEELSHNCIKGIPTAFRYSLDSTKLCKMINTVEKFQLFSSEENCAKIDDWNLMSDDILSNIDRFCLFGIETEKLQALSPEKLSHLGRENPSILSAINHRLMKQVPKSSWNGLTESQFSSFNKAHLFKRVENTDARRFSLVMYVNSHVCKAIQEAGIYNEALFNDHCKPILDLYPPFFKTWHLVVLSVGLVVIIVGGGLVAFFVFRSQTKGSKIDPEEYIDEEDDPSPMNEENESNSKNYDTDSLQSNRSTERMSKDFESEAISFTDEE